jgi:hypothetical protein
MALEEEARNATLTLVSLLDRPINLIMARQRGSALDRFLVGNLRDIVAIAIGNHPSFGPDVVRACLDLILDSSISWLEEMSAIAAEILDLLISFALDDKGPYIVSNLLRIMSMFINVIFCEDFAHINRLDIIFQKLFFLSPGPEIDDAFIRLMEMPPSFFVSFLSDSGCLDFVLNYISEQATTNILLLRAIQMIHDFWLCLSNKRSFRLSEPCVSRLILIGLTHTELRVRSSSLRTAVLIAVTEPNIDLWFHVIDSLVNDICRYIIENPFRCDSKYCCMLIERIILPGNTLEQCVIDLFDDLINRMFDFPCFSMLHMSLLRLFQQLLKLPSQFAMIVNKKGLAERIPNVFFKRDLVNGSFWGVLNRIAAMMKMVEGDLKTGREWFNYVRLILKPTHEVCLTGYGGRKHVKVEECDEEEEDKGEPCVLEEDDT